MGNAEYMGIIKYSRYYCSKMVTKTEKCSYTEYKIVPGRGSRFISKDGRTHYFISTKARSLSTRRSSLSSSLGLLHGEPITRRLKLTNFRRSAPVRPPASKRLSLACPLKKSAERRPSLVRTETRPTILLLNRSRIAKPRPCRPRKPTRRSSRRMLPRLLTRLSRRSPVARAERDE